MDDLTIRAVSKLTQLSEFILRAWEKRYGAVKPRRDSLGRRVYSAADVEKLRLLKALSDGGQNIGQIAPLSLAKLKKIQVELSKSSLRHHSQVNQLIRLIAELDLSGFTSTLRSLQLRFDTRVFLTEVIAPFLQQIGKEVADGELDIFHEHAASAILRNVLSGILYLTEQALEPATSISLVLSTPENDLHEFGILICAILAMLAGHRVLYLGPNLPASSVAEACKYVKASVAVLGVTSGPEVVSKEVLADYISSLDRALPRATQIWYGGGRFSEIRSSKSATARTILGLGDFASFEQLLQQRS